MKKQYSYDELVSIQVQKEIGMKIAGVERFGMNNDRAIKEGSASETQWNRRIMQELVTPMAEAVQTYIDYYTGRRGKPSASLSYLKALPVNQSAYITIKSILDSLTRETEAMTVAKTIGSRIEDQVRFAGVAAAAPKYIEKVHKAIAQSNSHTYQYQQAKFSNAAKSLALGSVEKGIEAKPELLWEPWPEQELTQLGSHLITIFAENVLFDGEPVVYKRVFINGKSNKVWITPTEHLTDWIDRYKEEMEGMAPMFAPCVIPPREWVSTTKGGYHIPEISCTLPLIKCRVSQQRRLSINQMPEVYKAINTLQNVAWQINDRTYETLRSIVALGIPLGIPSREPLEFPVSPVGIEYEGLKGQALKDMMSEQEWADFSSWKRETTNLHGMENKRKADYVKLARVMGSAAQYQEFERIYFVYTMDFRGRVYCKSDSVSPQGEDVQKGLLQFANAEPLGENGRYWLAVHGANVFGNDKVSFDERAAFIEGMNETIRDIAADPLTFTEWAGADKPYQFLTWCFEWAALLDHEEDGKPAMEFGSRIPVAMDGSCSGIQHYSAILRDPIGGSAVNLVPDTLPHDIYGNVAKVAEVLFTDMAANDPDSLTRETCQTWLNVKGGISRSLTKPPVMTKVYGSTQIRCTDTTRDYLLELQTKANKSAKAQGLEPERVHGFAYKVGDKGISLYDASVIGSKVIWQSINDVVVAAREGMKYIQDVASRVAKEDSHLEWVTPTGFIVEQREYDSTSRRVKTQLMGTTFVSLRQELPTFNVRKMRSASAPNFIHSMDASHLIKAVNEMNHQGINSIAVIHDSFACHANAVPAMRDALRSTFVGMYQENDVMGQFKAWNEQLLGKPIDVDVPEQMGLDLKVALESEYLFA